jgi:hypothetical protein
MHDFYRIDIIIFIVVFTESGCRAPPSTGGGLGATAPKTDISPSPTRRRGGGGRGRLEGGEIELDSRHYLQGKINKIQNPY